MMEENNNKTTNEVGSQSTPPLVRQPVKVGTKILTLPILITNLIPSGQLFA